jgi:hypothetical protein
MSDPTHLSVDVTAVDDPQARRVLRAIQHEYQTALTRQQVEIDVIFEVLLEKHLTSVGELRRHMTKLQQQQTGVTGRTGRLHDHLWGTTPAAPAHPTPPGH